MPPDVEVKQPETPAHLTRRDAHTPPAEIKLNSPDDSTAQTQQTRSLKESLDDIELKADDLNVNAQPKQEPLSELTDRKLSLSIETA